MNTTNGTVLYGVPRAYYGAFGGCTPLPICLTSCAQYLGLTLSYQDFMVYTGAAFRLTWNPAEWDGGNVDTTYAFSDPWKPGRLGVQAMGRHFDRVERSAGKQAFIDFLKPRLDAGVPVIALGIIGPPEACVITGYREDGQTLLGWNLFQDIPEFGGAQAPPDDSGYFISGDWWENENTTALYGIGQPEGGPPDLAQVVEIALEVMRGREEDGHAKGLAAYDAWKVMLLDDSQFPPQAILPVLSERMMCQGDAMDCLADGRHSAAEFFTRMTAEHPAHAATLTEVAGHFRALADLVQQMFKILGGWERGEAQMRKLALPETRQELGGLIDRMKIEDQQAMEGLKRLKAVL